MPEHCVVCRGGRLLCESWKMSYLLVGEAEGELLGVLSREVPWETYATARLISDKDLQLIRRYDKRSEQLQSSMLDEAS